MNRERPVRARCVAVARSTNGPPRRLHGYMRLHSTLYHGSIMAPFDNHARVVPTNPSGACDEVSALDIPHSREFDALAFEFRGPGRVGPRGEGDPELFSLICILSTRP